MDLDPTTRTMRYSNYCGGVKLNSPPAAPFVSQNSLLGVSPFCLDAKSAGQVVLSGCGSSSDLSLTSTQLWTWYRMLDTNVLYNWRYGNSGCLVAQNGTVSSLRVGLCVADPTLLYFGLNQQGQLQAYAPVMPPGTGLWVLKPQPVFLDASSTALRLDRDNLLTGSMSQLWATTCQATDYSSRLVVSLDFVQNSTGFSSTSLISLVASSVPGLSPAGMTQTIIEYIVRASVSLFNVPSAFSVTDFTTLLAGDLPFTEAIDVKVTSTTRNAATGALVLNIDISGYASSADAYAEMALLRDPGQLDQAALGMNTRLGVDQSAMLAARYTQSSCEAPPTNYPDNACPLCPGCVYFDVSNMNMYTAVELSFNVDKSAVDLVERQIADAVTTGQLSSALANLVNTDITLARAAHRHLLQLSGATDSSAAAAVDPSSFGTSVTLAHPLQAVRYARAGPADSRYISAAIALGGYAPSQFGQLHATALRSAIARVTGAAPADVTITAVSSPADVAASMQGAATQRRLFSTSSSSALATGIAFTVTTSAAAADAVFAGIAGSLDAAAMRGAMLDACTSVVLVAGPTVSVGTPPGDDVADSLPLLPLAQEEVNNNLLGLLALLALLPIGIAAGWFAARRGMCSPRGSPLVPTAAKGDAASYQDAPASTIDVVRADVPAAADAGVLRRDSLPRQVAAAR